FSFSNTFKTRSQVRFVDEMLKTSFVVCTFAICGPNETASSPSILAENIPHSSPAWIPSTTGSFPYNDLYVSTITSRSLESDLYSHPGYAPEISTEPPNNSVRE